jgi:hypothetical protein
MNELVLEIYEEPDQRWPVAKLFNAHILYLLESIESRGLAQFNTSYAEQIEPFKAELHLKLSLAALYLNLNYSQAFLDASIAQIYAQQLRNNKLEA